MARAPSRFSLKIQKRVFVKALLGDGINSTPQSKSATFLYQKETNFWQSLLKQMQEISF
jgi:hypothetical protein